MTIKFWSFCLENTKQYYICCCKQQSVACQAIIFQSILPLLRQICRTKGVSVVNCRALFGWFEANKWENKQNASARANAHDDEKAIATIFYDPIFHVVFTFKSRDGFFFYIFSCSPSVFCKRANTLCWKKINSKVTIQLEAVSSLFVCGGCWF